MKRLAILMVTSYPDRMHKWVIPTIKNLDALADTTRLYLYCNGSRYNQGNYGDIVNKLKESSKIEIVSEIDNDTGKFFDEAGDLKYLDVRLYPGHLMSDEEYVLLLDDDMTFGAGATADNRSSGEQFRDAIEFLDRHPQCGGVQWTGTLGLKATPPKTYRVFCPNRFEVGVQKGLMLRRIRDERWDKCYGIVPEEYAGMVGAGDDQVMMLARMSAGYWFVKQTCGRVTHYASTKAGEGWNREGIISGPNGYKTLLKKYDGVVITNKYNCADPDARARECKELGIKNDIQGRATHSHVIEGFDWTCGQGHKLVTD
jgi:hypothetical protein